MANIAFIGLGNMGGPMAANLVKAGHKVQGFDLVQASKDAAKADGVGIAATAADAVKDADIVITMLPAGKHVLSVWKEIVPSVGKNTLMIDCSTIDVESARLAHAHATEHNLPSIDAPVSGGTGGAKGATLTFMCGGEDFAFRRREACSREHGQEGRALRRGRCGTSRQDLQQHDPRYFDDRRVGSFCARRKAGLVASGAVRCGIDIVGSVLVADDLLPGAGSGSGFACQQ